MMVMCRHAVICQQVSVVRRAGSESAEANEGVADLSSHTTEIKGAFMYLTLGELAYYSNS